MQNMNAIYISLIIGCYIAERSNCRAVYISHSVTLFEPLLLEGCDEKGAKVEWKFDNNLLFLDDRLLFVTGLDNITLLPNNSVLIEHASIKHGGTYVCVSASKAVVSHDVNVEAPPHMYIASSNMYTASGNHIYLQQDHLTLLTCFANGSRPEVNLTLLVDAIVYGTSNITITHGSGKTETFDTMVTVFIQAVNENGNISCQSNGVGNHSFDGLTLRYTSFVSPHMSLSKDGNDISDAIWLEENEKFNITCNALNSKPRVHLTWNSSLIEDRNMTNWNPSTTGSQLFNSTSVIEYEVGNSNDTLTCSAGFEDAQIQWNTSIFIRSYVPPVMSLSKDGNEISDEILLQENKTFNITCHALNSKPMVHLTWISSLMEERKMTTWNTSTTGSQLFNSTSVIEYEVGSSSDTLTCSAGFEDAELQWNTSVFIRSYESTTETIQSSVTASDPPAETTTEHDDNSLPVELKIGLSLVIAILLIFSTITFAILLKKLFGHRTMTLPTDQRAQGNIRPLPLALISRELPPIYDQTDMINDDVAEQSIDDTVIGLNSEDVQLNFQLPGAGTMKYWVATYSSEGDKVTKIIAKSVSENARMKEILNFRALAKNATIMPRHQNIVDVLGVSLEDVPYFIYQEYIEYGTLKDFLMRNYQESSGGSSKQDTPDQEKTLHLTMFAADICEGMLFLKKQNCHHPGLAARKVLLSPSGRCKLYDFWPVDLAQDRVKQILDKKVPPLAWLAPETVFLGHFMEKSDIWNFGVVLWEIYSLGEIPFGGLTCAEIESKLRNKESLDQPLTCPGGIFGHMLATWNSAIDERPTFEHLNVTLSSFLYDMRESLNNENDNSEEPNYFRLDKDSSSSDDYIEHII